MDVPFKGGPDIRAHELKIYESGIQVVNFLQKLAKSTGPGVPNPVPSILEALVGVLTQLKVCHFYGRIDSRLTRITSKW